MSLQSCLQAKGARLCALTSANQWPQSGGNSWGEIHLRIFSSQSSWQQGLCLSGEKESEQCTILFHSLCRSGSHLHQTINSLYLGTVTPGFRFVSSSRKTYDKWVSRRNYSSRTTTDIHRFPPLPSILNSFLLIRVACLVT